MKMKQMILVVVFAAMMSGCAALGYVKSCMDDPVCFAERMAAAEKVKGQVSAVASVASPLPWAGPVAGGIAGIGTLLVGLYLGGKKKQAA